MSFLGMGPLEILVILLAAFIFLGPERMTDAARFLAKAVREGRNLASSIPRVVVEDDDIKVVQDGRTTSLTKQDSDADGAKSDDKREGGSETDDGAVSTSHTASADSSTTAPDDGGPVPFSRRPSPAPPPPAPEDRNDGQQR